MFDAKYKREFSFKSLSYKDIKKIIEIIDESEEFEMFEIYSSRLLKCNKIKNFDKKIFKGSQEFLDYLNADVKCLDNLKFVFVDKNYNRIVLEYDDIYYRWELTYYVDNLQINGLILKLNSIFKKSILGCYKQFQWIIIWYLAFFCVCFTLLKYNVVFLFSLFMLLIILLSLAIIFKCKPYHNNKFINNNKDSIILGFLFYALGIITPSLIDVVRNIFK